MACDTSNDTPQSEPDTLNATIHALENLPILARLEFAANFLFDRCGGSRELNPARLGGGHGHRSPTRRNRYTEKTSSCRSIADPPATIDERAQATIDAKRRLTRSVVYETLRPFPVTLGKGSCSSVGNRSRPMDEFTRTEFSDPLARGDVPVSHAISWNCVFCGRLRLLPVRTTFSERCGHCRVPEVL